jgi:beta-lactam-binding protein with PASTA domain
MGNRSRVLLGIGSVIVAVIVVGVALKYGMRSRHPDTVVVPRVRSVGLAFSFDRLRDRGLRVAIPSRMHFYPTSSPMLVGQAPRAGKRVKWGSVVTLRVVDGPIASPIGPRKPPVYRVPDFRGKPLADVVSWTQGKWVYWTTDLPPLPPSSARDLFEAYVVTSQRPVAGSNVKLSVPVRVRRLGRGVRLTPLALEVALRGS